MGDFIRMIFDKFTNGEATRHTWQICSLPREVISTLKKLAQIDILGISDGVDWELESTLVFTTGLRTLLPSISKWVKLTVILHCGGARISQMQFLLAGYKSGKDGELIVPFDASIMPPQASVK